MQQADMGGGSVAGKATAKTAEQGASVEAQRSSQKKAKKPKKRYQHDVFRAWCKQCGICVAFCPVQVLAQDEMGHPYAKHSEACIGCQQCELRCPDFAITVLEEEAQSREGGSVQGER